MTFWAICFRTVRGMLVRKDIFKDKKAAFLETLWVALSLEIVSQDLNVKSVRVRFRTLEIYKAKHKKKTKTHEFNSDP